VGQYGTTSSLRFDGASPIKALQVRRSILNVILDFTGSQCRAANTAASFWINWRDLRDLLEKPGSDYVAMGPLHIPADCFTLKGYK